MSFVYLENYKSIETFFSLNALINFIYVSMNKEKGIEHMFENHYQCHTELNANSQQLNKSSQS